MMPAMTDDPTVSRKLAVLINADNASSAIAAGLFEEIAKIGKASVRRIYDDFTGTRLKGWAEIAPLYACLPHQNFAMVIDAMDLLHSGRLTASA
jgi:ADP-heptose:LPS heptosyltransferase